MGVKLVLIHVLNYSLHYGIEMYGRSVYRSFLTSSVVEGEWSASRPGSFTRGKGSLGSHLIGSWLNSSACLEGVASKKNLLLPGLELQPIYDATQ
jgi:hypothetical protein